MDVVFKPKEVEYTSLPTLIKSTKSAVAENVQCDEIIWIQTDHHIPKLIVEKLYRVVVKLKMADLVIKTIYVF